MNGMNCDGACCVPAGHARGFWTRQFDEAPTRAQRWFDAVFGVVLPILCFYFDPIVFRTWGDEAALYSRYQLYIYSFSAVEIVALCAWLLPGARVGRQAHALAGILFAGAAFSIGIGVLILPLSIVGLIFIIGALGFTPFLTGFVYLRNGVRAALPEAREGEPMRPCAAAALVCGFVFALAAPAVAQLNAGHEAAPPPARRRLSLID